MDRWDAYLKYVTSWDTGEKKRGFNASFPVPYLLS